MTISAEGDASNRKPAAAGGFLGFYRWFAGAAAIALGLAGLLGWWLGIAVLVRVKAGWPGMKPVPAVLCVLCGVGLLLTGRASSARARAVGKVVVAGAGLLALERLLEVFCGFSLGLDRFIVGRSVGSSLGRTAFTYLLLAGAMLTLDRRSSAGHSLSQVLALAAGSIASVALLGYAFGIWSLHSPGTAAAPGGMAIHTAFGIIILASGVLVARPNVGMVSALTSEHAGGLVGRRLWLALLAFAPVALLVVTARRLGWIDDPGVTALLVFLALAEGAVMIQMTALRLNDYDRLRKATEAQLRASEQRLSQVISQAPDGIFIADLEGRYTDVNAAGARLLGLPPEAIIGRSILEFIPAEDVERLWRQKDELLRAGGAVRVAEWSMRHLDGHYVPVEVSATILPDGRWQGFVRDITERKELERLREEWASVIAHDLRQPIGAISLSAETLQQVAGPKASELERRAVARIRSGAARLNRMIEDLFDASRIEANQLSVSPRVVDLGALVCTTAESLSGATGDHEIIVDAPQGQEAWIDADRIQQVLTNLMTNAVKYADAGTAIRVAVTGRDELLEVSVANWGVGITAEELPRLFSRFGRTRGARATGTPGTGLGLYIAKGLVDAHGGHIWVDSTPGQWTTFHFVVARAPDGVHAPLAAMPSHA